MSYNVRLRKAPDLKVVDLTKIELYDSWGTLKHQDEATKSMQNQYDYFVRSDVEFVDLYLTCDPDTTCKPRRRLFG